MTLYTCSTHNYSGWGEPCPECVNCWIEATQATPKPPKSPVIRYYTQDQMDIALAAAREKGRREMKEEAAQLMERHGTCTRTFSEDGKELTCRYPEAEAIRALPDKEEKG